MKNYFSTTLYREGIGTIPVEVEIDRFHLARTRDLYYGDDESYCQFGDARVRKSFFGDEDDQFYEEGSAVILTDEEEIELEQEVFNEYMAA